MTQYSNWIGRQETAFDTVTAAHVARFCAMLDRPLSNTGVCPQSIHWTLCPTSVATAALRSDGHPAPSETGLVLADAPARRMWASSAVEFHAPIHIGDAMERRSVVADVTVKQGRTGTLVFVDVDHIWLANGLAAVKERQTIVYRDDAPSVSTSTTGQGAAPLDPAIADYARTLTPDTSLLFRYSALTFNSHRIHYDLPFARDVEGYPDLVVQGPLTATLLIDLVSNHDLGHHVSHNILTKFQFRGVAPAFVAKPMYLSAQRSAAPGELILSANGEGRQIMQARATLAHQP